MAPTKTDFRLARRVTASTWGNAFWAQWNQARVARGTAKASDATITPRVTNREAVAIINAWRGENSLTSQPFSLWYQFAAIAYGWMVDKDTLAATSPQATRLYPVDATKELWLAVQRIANRLEIERPDVAVALDVDPDAFMSPTFRGEVGNALRGDGANAEWLVGVGGCKDPKTGKVRPFPKGSCKVKWTAVGPILHSCKFEKCDPVRVEIDDPLGVKPLLLIALVLGAWWAYGNEATRRHARRA